MLILHLLIHALVLLHVLLLLFSLTLTLKSIMSNRRLIHLLSTHSPSMLERNRRPDPIIRSVRLPIIPLLITFRANAHLLIELVIAVVASHTSLRCSSSIDSASCRMHLCRLLTLLSLGPILLVVLLIIVVLILQEVLIIDLAHIEVAKLTVSVIGPVSVMLGFLSVDLGMHLGLGQCLRDLSFKRTVEVSGLRCLLVLLVVGGLRGEVMRRGVLRVSVAMYHSGVATHFLMVLLCHSLVTVLAHKVPSLHA